MEVVKKNQDAATRMKKRWMSVGREGRRTPFSRAHRDRVGSKQDPEGFRGNSQLPRGARDSLTHPKRPRAIQVASPREEGAAGSAPR